MQLVEQHVIDRKDPRYMAIDSVSFASKNLYNAALYVLRQAYILEGRYLSYTETDKRMQQHEAYKALPAKVAQKALDQLDKAWQSFFDARKAYKEDPAKFLGCPRLPKYKHKTKGRNLLVYTQQAVTGVDIGLNNLAAIASDKPGFVPVLVNGRPAKSINQYYTKRRAQLQKKRKVHGEDTSRMERLTTKRTRWIHHNLHTASRQIIALLVKEGIGTLVIGKNPRWKQEVNQGKRNNQNTDVNGAYNIISVRILT